MYALVLMATIGQPVPPPPPPPGCSNGSCSTGRAVTYSYVPTYSLPYGAYSAPGVYPQPCPSSCPTGCPSCPTGCLTGCPTADLPSSCSASDFAALAPPPPPPALTASDFAALETRVSRLEARVAKLEESASFRALPSSGYGSSPATTGVVMYPSQRNVVAVPAAAVSYSTVGASGVASSRPFSAVSASRALFYNPSHACPGCGRSQYEVSGRGPVAGSHTHTCSYCGTSWYH